MVGHDKDTPLQTFEIWAKRRIYGEFVTQDRTLIIDVVKLKSVEDAKDYVRFLNLTDKTAYAVPVLGD
jgi:hypothetical protein